MNIRWYIDILIERSYLGEQVVNDVFLKKILLLQFLDFGTMLKWACLCIILKSSQKKSLSLSFRDFHCITVSICESARVMSVSLVSHFYQFCFTRGKCQSMPPHGRYIYIVSLLIRTNSITTLSNFIFLESINLTRERMWA